MLRRLLTFFSIASLVLLIAISILWLRSYHFTDSLSSRSSAGHQSLRSREGHVVLYFLHADWSNQPPDTFGLKYNHDEPGPASNDLSVRHMLCYDVGTTETYWQHGQFAWWERRRPDGVLYLMAVAPFWSLALVTAALPLAWSALRLRAKIRSCNKGRGRCATCGYDLRATPDRCPECGTPVVPNQYHHSKSSGSSLDAPSPA